LKKYISSFVCGFGAGVLQIVPVMKSLACCFIMPIAAILSLFLEQRAQNNYEKIPMKKALLFGLMTGLYAAIFGSIFDLLITLITKRNDILLMFPDLQQMLASFPVTEDIKKQVLDLFEGVRRDITNYGFSSLYTFSVVINNFIINPLFGIIGGLIGAQILNRRNQKNQVQ
jgi:hypothetical protein